MNYSFNDYQQDTARTANQSLNYNDKLTNWSMGIAGEAGEVVELVKKHLFHGKPLDRDKLKLELGDVLFYISEMCSANQLSLLEVATANIAKLKERYPNKFVPGGGNRG